jgi:hypothetical protein
LTALLWRAKVMAVAEEKDWLGEGLDAVEQVFNELQESYDSLPDKKTAISKLASASETIKKELDPHYGCQFARSSKAINKAIRQVDTKKDPDQIYRKVERTISKDIRECFKQQYGEIL